MITEKNTIKAEAIFDETHQHRLWWSHTWDKQKPNALIITLHPAISDTIMMDTTTFLCVNGVRKLEAESYGGVIIVNLFSLLTPKLQMRWARDIDINHLENDNYIKKAAEESSKIIFAWGHPNNVRILNRAKQVVELLSEHKEKFCVISDGKRKLLHPLTPECRNTVWGLESFDFQETFADIIKDKKNTEIVVEDTNKNAPT